MRQVGARLYQKVSAQIILLLTFAGLLYFLTYFTLNSRYAQHAFDELVNSQFRGKISWSRLSWGPIPWQIRVLDAVLLDAEGIPIISAREVHLRRIYLLGLLNGRIWADGVTIEGAVIRLEAGPNADAPDPFGIPRTVYNIEEMFWPPEGPSDEEDGQPGGVHLRFDDATILDAQVSVVAPGFSVRSEDVRLWGVRFELVPGVEDGLLMGAEQVNSPRGRVDVELDTERPGLELPLPYQNLTGHHFHWAKSVFGLADFRARINGDPVRIKPFQMDLNTPIASMTAKVEAQVADLGRQLAPFGVEGIHGPVRVEGRLSGEVNSLAIWADAKGTDLVASGYNAKQYHVIGEMTPEGRLRAQAFTLKSDEGTITGHADFDPSSGLVLSEIELDGVDLKGIPVELPPQVLTLAKGPIKGRVRFRGTHLFDEQRRFSTELNLRLSRTGGRLYGLGRRTELNAIVNLEADMLSVPDLSLSVDGDQVTSHGVLDLKTGALAFDGRAHLKQVEPLADALDLPLEGDVRVIYSVRGQTDAPIIEATIDGRHVRYDTFPQANITGRIWFAGNQLKISEMTVNTDIGKASVNGVITLGAVPRLKLAVRARKVDISALPIDVNAAGFLDATVQIRGTTRRPTISGKVHIAQPRYADLAYHHIDLEGRYAGDEVQIKRIQLHDDERGLIDANGRVNLRTKTFDGRLNLDRLPLSMLDRFTPKPLGVEGTVSLDLGGSGAFDDPQGQGMLILEGIKYQGMDLGDAKLKVSAVGRSIQLSGRLFDDFSIEVAIPAEPGGPPAEGTVRFDGLRVERFVPALKKANVETHLTGRVTASMDLFMGVLGEVQAELAELRLDYRMVDRTGQVIPPPNDPNCGHCATATLQNDGPLKVSFRHGVLNLDQVAFKGANQRIELQGSLDAAGGLDMRVCGGLSLQALQPFLTSAVTQIQGTGILDLELSGHIADPAFFGSVTLSDVEMFPRSSTVGSEIRIKSPVELSILPPYGPLPLAEGGLETPRGVFSVTLPPVKRSTASVCGMPQGSEVGGPNRFLIRRDEADIEVTRLGIFFEEFVPQSLLVEAEGSELVVNVPRMMRATVDISPLRFEMWTHRMERRLPETRLRLSGDVNVLRGEYTQDIQSAQELNEGFRNSLRGTRRAERVSIFERSPIIKRLMLDLRVNIDNDFFIRNQVTVLRLDIETRARLAVRGFLYAMPDDRPEEALRIAGRIEALEDSKIIYGRRDFEVHSGRVMLGSGNAQDLETSGDFVNVVIEASHTFRLRTDQGSGVSSFTQAGNGQERLEEVTLTIGVHMPTKDSRPEYNLSFSSNSGASQIDVATLVLTGSYPSGLTGAAGAQPATEVLLSPLLSLVERPLEETLEIDLTLTPANTGTLYIDADKLLSRRLRLYTRTPVGNEDSTALQKFGLEYRINNVTYWDLTNQQLANLNTSSGRLRLHLSFD